MSDVVFMKTAALRKRLREGGFSGELSRLYCCREGGAGVFARRFLEVMDRFEAAFGPADELALFSSPGRTEIGGNHTDHQSGHVLAGSVNLDIIAAAAPNRAGMIRLQSGDRPLDEVDLAGKTPRPEEARSSGALIRGVAAGLAGCGCEIGGVDVCAVSDVRSGSGLSSSAAFEMLVARILADLSGLGGVVPPLELAKAGRLAENVFYGKPCGLMDQVACLFGGLVGMDFGNPEQPGIRRLELDLQAAGHALCIIDCGADHAGMSELYADIPREMAEVAACFGKTRLREVARDEFLAGLPAARKRAGDRAVLRAWHFFNDDLAAREEERALREGRFGDFLRIFNASGRSSWTRLQNVSPPGASRRQEMALALALCEELLRGEGGCRVHGGGFAGTAQAFVPLPRLEGFVAGLEAALGAGCCRTLSIRGVGGVRLA